MKKRVPVWLDIAGVVFGVAVAMYTGALLGVCKTFPLWNNALLPILFLVSAMSTGAASVLLIGLVLPTALETWLLFFSPKEFEESRKAHWISAASDAGVLVGGFLLRYLVVVAALPLTMVVPML